MPRIKKQDKLSKANDKIEKAWQLIKLSSKEQLTLKRITLITVEIIIVLGLAFFLLPIDLIEAPLSYILLLILIILFVYLQKFY